MATAVMVQANTITKEMLAYLLKASPVDLSDQITRMMRQPRSILRNTNFRSNFLERTK